MKSKYLTHTINYRYLWYAILILFPYARACSKSVAMVNCMWHCRTSTNKIKDKLRQDYRDTSIHFVVVAYTSFSDWTIDGGLFSDSIREETRQSIRWADLWWKFHWLFTTFVNTYPQNHEPTSLLCLVRTSCMYAYTYRGYPHACQKRHLRLLNISVDGDCWIA